MLTLQEIKRIDWWLVGLFVLLTIVGWFNIFSAVYSPDQEVLFTTSTRYGMQAIWIVTSYLLAFAILFFINPKAYQGLSLLIYLATLLLLVITVFKGVEVSGSRSWLEFGSIRIQPAELSKLTTAIALAALTSSYGYSLKSPKWAFFTAVTILTPALLIVMQKETGTALVYAAFILVLYLQGMSGWFLATGVYSIFLFLITLGLSPYSAIIILLVSATVLRGVLSKQMIIHLLILLPFLGVMIYAPKLNLLYNLEEHTPFWKEIYLLVATLPLFGYHLFRLFKRKVAHMKGLTLLLITSILFIFSVEFLFEKVLQPHQKVRIENLLGIDVDLKGAGYNVHQSKIAIGSGGFSGKGYLNGTQTKYNFVPEQSTDFIFCTIGEEWGFLGSTLLIALFLFLIIRVTNRAAKQKDTFVKVFGFSLAAVIALHLIINIGMTIGLMPVIGIPLPFVSYGGSSLWSFTLFLFIFIRLDLDHHR